MNKEQEAKLEKAIDKMLGYKTFHMKIMSKEKVLKEVLIDAKNYKEAYTLATGPLREFAETHPPEGCYGQFPLEEVDESIEGGIF